ncbi:MAG: hypothetical protein ACE5JV_02775, partial [Nitrososphaerales archaeon]
KLTDGDVRFVKAKGWDRQKIDRSTVMIEADDRPLNKGRNMIVLLILESKASDLEWKAFDAERNLVSSGTAVAKG